MPHESVTEASLVMEISHRFVCHQVTEIKVSTPAVRMCCESLCAEVLAQDMQTINLFRKAPGAYILVDASWCRDCRVSTDCWSRHLVVHSCNGGRDANGCADQMIKCQAHASIELSREAE